MASSPTITNADLFLESTQPNDTFSETQSTAALGTPHGSYVSEQCCRRPAVPDYGTSQSHTERLDFLPVNEWDEYNSYDEDVPTRLRYSIEWKVTVNNKVVSKDTEQDVVLGPAVYWHMYLRSKVERLVSRKLPPSRKVEYDDTNVVASVNDRSERDLTKQFDGMDIDWSVVARQLIRWGELFRLGKKLRIDLSFNYMESPQAAGRVIQASQRGSASQRMLADRASQLGAEQESGERASIWREVYALMRCPGPPCNFGPHCWRDPFGKKHYKLRTHHLKALIESVQEGLALNTHDDVPQDIRDQLYAEDHQRRDRQATGASASTPNLPPITINNVIPSPSQDFPLSRSMSAPSVAQELSVSGSRLNIPGPRDLAVLAYCEWQQSNVVDEGQKKEYQKARDAMLEEMLDLEQVYKDQNPDFFIRAEVKSGVARRFVSDIPRWAEQYSTTYHGEDV